MDSACLVFKSSLPVTLILFSGVVLLSASVGSTHLDSIQHYLSKASQDNSSLLSHSISTLGIVLIVAGIAFRMGAIPIHFHCRTLLKTAPYWQSTSFALISVCAGAAFLTLFLNKIAVINFGYTEQVLYFIALIVLAATAGLLLVEKELKVTLILLVLQITGVFFAQLSVTCWKWRHDLFGGESVSILDMTKEFSPLFLFSLLAVMGLACLLDSLSSHQSQIIYQDQLQGLIKDQRLLGGAAIILLATLMGFPGLSGFRLKWQTLLSLFQIHQEQSTGAMAIIHTGYFGLAVLMLISCTIVAFVCAKLIIQVSFAKPLARNRLIQQKRMAFICYCCVIVSLIFNLRWIANF
jgi:NADH:ubiquinone oxidoreductase subunit 2 (subunit N)